MKRIMLAIAASLTLVLAACGQPGPQLKTIAEVADEDGRFTILLAALAEAELAATFADPTAGPFTVFAPTDEAFTALLDALGIDADALLANPNLGAILQYHVLAGQQSSSQVAASSSLETLLGATISVTVENGRVFLNDEVEIIVTDLAASNGVIHVIDAVLLPPTVVEIAVANDAFSILVQAVTTAGLADTLGDINATFTVFAPTNDAFEALAAELGVAVADLLELPDLADILRYHVVAGRVTSDVVVTLPSATTLQGSDIDIEVIDDGGVVLNGRANVTAVDIQALNGVIHVIDAVLLPPSEE